MLEPETFKHLFYQCPLILNLWTKLSDYIFNRSGKRITFDIQSVLLGDPDMDHVVNLIIILVKKFIFQRSRKDIKICFEMLMSYLQTYYNTERKLFTTVDFTKRWSPWSCLFPV